MSTFSCLQYLSMKKYLSALVLYLYSYITIVISPILETCAQPLMCKMTVLALVPLSLKISQAIVSEGQCSYEGIYSLFVECQNWPLFLLSSSLLPCTDCGATAFF